MKIILSIAAFLSVLVSVTVAAAAEQPNIVVIFADDLGVTRIPRSLAG